jgi:hypothetical protein
MRQLLIPCLIPCLIPKLFGGFVLEVALFTELEDYAVKHLAYPGAGSEASTGCYMGCDEIPVFVVEP